MKIGALLLLLFLPAVPGPSTLRYERSVSVPSAGQACAVLDPAIYAHAAGSLADLRLRSPDGRAELPFVLTMSQSATGESAPAAVTNLRQQGRALAFDLTMPPRLYTDVVLDLHAENFIATAVVTGRSPAPTPLGSFTLFDLSAQHLPRNSTLPLQEVNFPVLHVRLVPSIGSPSLTTDMVSGASVPPSREAQTLYTSAARTSHFDQTAQETRTKFTVPAHLPVERISVTLAPGFRESFERQVRIASHAVGEAQAAGEQVTGAIDRVHLTQDGAVLRSEHLSVPATLGANLQHPAEVEVAIENEGAPPLPITSIALETREHELCFFAPDTRGALLFYGDPHSEPARYDPARILRPGLTTVHAVLGPEQENPRYRPRTDHRPLLKRHPRLVYLSLILLVCLLATVALRSSRLRL